MKKQIEWLLLESDVSNYQISQATGISAVMLHKYTTGKSVIGNMTLDNAIKLQNYYMEVIKMAKPYQVSAYREVVFTNTYGMEMEEHVDHIDVDCGTSDKAEKVARELYDTGKYTHIYIDYAHPQQAACFYNPHGGMNPEDRKSVV